MKTYHLNPRCAGIQMIRLWKLWMALWSSGFVYRRPLVWPTALPSSFKCGALICWSHTRDTEVRCARKNAFEWATGHMKVRPVVCAMRDRGWDQERGFLCRLWIRGCCWCINPTPDCHSVVTPSYLLATIDVLHRCDSLLIQFFQSLHEAALVITKYKLQITPVKL